MRRNTSSALPWSVSSRNVSLGTVTVDLSREVKCGHLFRSDGRYTSWPTKQRCGCFFESKTYVRV